MLETAMQTIDRIHRGIGEGQGHLSILLVAVVTAATAGGQQGSQGHQGCKMLYGLPCERLTQL